MQRIFSIMLIFLLTAVTVFPAVGEVSAETGNENDVHADGAYNLPFEVWKADEDKVSVAAEYFEAPARLIVENGEFTIQTTLKNAAWWQYFKVASGDSFVDVTEVSKDEEADTSVVEFKVEDLDELLQAKMHIIVTGIPNFEYDSEHDVRLKFDPANITPVSEEDSIGLEDGDYSIGFEALHETEEKPSNAAPYLVNPTKLSVQDGQAQINLTLTDHETIKDFKVEQNGEFVSAEIVEVNETANTRVVSFAIDNVEEVINAQVKVYVAQMDYTGEYGIRLILDEDSIKEFDGSEMDEDQEAELTDGHYTINYRTLHATEFEKSRMGDYLVTPANLLINNDKNTVTITITDHKTVTDFKVNQNGEWKDAKVVKVNEADNTRDVSFEIDSLDAVVNVQVEVFVEAANHTGNYDVRLFFEENSVTEKEAPFSDVATHWEKMNIITAYENGWFNGYEDGEFKPNDPVTRIQSASLFTRILGLTERKEVPFTDVRTIEAETKEELEQAYANGVINGYEDNTFKPYQKVTRAQLALMIYRSYEIVTGTPYEPKQAADFPDIGGYNEETKTAIAMLKELDIISGNEKGEFNPGSQASRAHAAKMLVNYKEVLDAIE